MYRLFSAVTVGVSVIPNGNRAFTTQAAVLKSGNLAVVFGNGYRLRNFSFTEQTALLFDPDLRPPLR
eukprot:646757-Prorocentrum_minimum.AAC.1